MSAAEQRRPEYLKPGARIDGYLIITRLGSGSYGAVYLVERDGERFALKLGLHREASADPEQTDRRMMKELGCLIHLRHPHVLRVHAWGRWPQVRDGYCYLVVDYVDGWTLAEWLEARRPTFAQVAGLFAKLAAALAYVHGRGFLHRDLSPGNILVRKADEAPFLADFNAGDYVLAEDVTDTPLPPGTNRYRDPRAVAFWREHRHQADARYDFQAADDQFSLAACLYDAVTDPTPTVPARQRPGPRQDLNSPLWPPPEAREVNERVPEALSALLNRLLAREPRQRPATADAMRRELEELAAQPGTAWALPVFPPSTPAPPLEGGGTPPWKRWRGAASVVTAALLAAVLFQVARREASGPGASPAPVSLAPASRPAGRDTGLPPSAAPPPGVALPSPPVDPSQKKAPTVTPSPAAPLPEKPKKSRSAPSATLLARCAGVGVFTAALLGCPGSQVMPRSRELCPDEAMAAMRDNRFIGSDWSWAGAVTVDIQQPSEWGRPGAVKVGVFHDGAVVGRIEEEKRAGTLIFGQLQTLERDGRFFLVGRYTRAKLNDGREIPVCLHLGPERINTGKNGSKKGAVLFYRVTSSEAVSRWP